MGEEKAPDGIDFRIRHTMFPVTDLERSLDFYSRLLGMKIMRRRVNEAKNVTVGYVGYGDEGSNHALELIQDRGAAADAVLGGWDGHIAIAVFDLYGLSEVLVKEGVRFDKPAGPVAPGRKDLVAFIRDPGGYEIELTQRQSDADAKPS